MTEGKSRRGFAGMDPETQRRIARMGGSAVPAEKRSFSKNAKLAAEAGRLGGLSLRAEDRSFSQDPALAARAGRLGGLNVPPEKRSFSTDPALAARVGRKGGKISRPPSMVKLPARAGSKQARKAGRNAALTRRLKNTTVTLP